MKPANDTPSIDMSALLMDETTLALRLGVSPRTLQLWRYKGEGGPRYLKIGSSVRYRPADVETWLESRTRECS